MFAGATKQASKKLGPQYQSVRDLSFTAIRDDNLAKEHLPDIQHCAEHGNPQKILYRAALDKKGNTHIAYHLVWDKEVNKESRYRLISELYSNTIQPYIWGKGDVELITITLGPDKKLKAIEYETPTNFKSGDVLVTHQTVRHECSAADKGYFVIKSWNHLFDFVPGRELEPRKKLTGVKLEYFSEEAWDDYQMVKEQNAYFRKHRAHKPFECIPLPKLSK